MDWYKSEPALGSNGMGCVVQMDKKRIELQLIWQPWTWISPRKSYKYCVSWCPWFLFIGHMVGTLWCFEGSSTRICFMGPSDAGWCPISTMALNPSYANPEQLKAYLQKRKKFSKTEVQLEYMWFRILFNHWVIRRTQFPNSMRQWLRSLPLRMIYVFSKPVGDRNNNV